MININYEKCIGCLKCVDKCVCGAIYLKDGKPEFDRKRGCIKCMHCAAACSENAFLWGDKPAVLSEETPIIEDTFSDDLRAFLLSRRSYRNFTEKEVPVEEIKDALEVASWAPSAKNQHPVKYCVMTKKTIDEAMEIVLKNLEKTSRDPEIINGLEHGVNMVFGKAQAVIMAYCKPNAVNPNADTALALDYAGLILQSKGIGSCWAGYLNRYMNSMPELKALFPIPEEASFYGCLLLGYPSEEYYYVPERVKRADVLVK